MEIKNEPELQKLAIKHAKAKSKNAKNIIFNQMEPLFREEIQKYLKMKYKEWHNQTSYEDLYQICLIAIEKTIKDFDPNKATYGAWVYVVISRKIVTEMKRLCTKKNKLSMSIDNYTEEQDEPSLIKILTKNDKTHLTIMANKEEVKELADKLLTVLSPSETLIFNAYYVNNFEDYMQVAKIAGVMVKGREKGLSMLIMHCVGYVPRQNKC